MKRIIKFRAWDGERMWFDVQKAYDNIDGDESNNDEAIPITNFGKVLSDWDVMQFTGLKDKNGKEIYEGDILGYWAKAVWGVGWDSDSSKFNFLYPKSTHPIHRFPRKAFNFSQSSIKGKEIIGNIYESPELLTN